VLAFLFTVSGKYKLCQARHFRTIPQLAIPSIRWWGVQGALTALIHTGVSDFAVTEPNIGRGGVGEFDTAVRGVCVCWYYGKSTLLVLLDTIIIRRPLTLPYCRRGYRLRCHHTPSRPGRGGSTRPKFQGYVNRIFG
jgi:hypothetical protein